MHHQKTPFSPHAFITVFQRDAGSLTSRCQGVKKVPKKFVFL